MAKAVLTDDVRFYIESCVLCWLATVSKDQMPNVSPKEVFRYFDPDRIIVAHIASPQTVKNILEQPRVCISFVDILVQKGFQVKGTARIVTAQDAEYPEMVAALNTMTQGRFPIASIISITPEQVKPILAPSYLLYPETTEAQQVALAKRSYGFTS